MEVTLLTDKTKLQEVYNLRVAAYEVSPYSAYINWRNYPNGYFDHLDSLDTTYHWIVENNKVIIGSTRAAIIKDDKDMDDTPKGLELPNERPFALCGRTAVHPDFRRTNTMRLLDQALVQFITSDRTIKFALCYVIPERINAVKRLGFQSIGKVSYNWGNGNISTLDALIIKAGVPFKSAL